jgi:hypothetical protein
VELRYPSGETQPTTGDPDGVQHSLHLYLRDLLSNFTCGSASTIRAPNHCAGPSRPTFCHLPTATATSPAAARPRSGPLTTAPAHPVQPSALTATAPAAARPRSGPLTTALARHVRPSAIYFHFILLRAVHRGANTSAARSIRPCDVRNNSLSGHKCLLRRTQVFGVGRGSLPAAPLTSGTPLRRWPSTC